MDRYKLPELQQLYFSHSQYSPAPMESPTDRLLQWPDTYHTLLQERTLLDATLTPPPPQPDNLAYQVFGRQLHLEGLSFKHLGQFLYERCKLHYTHVEEINHRHGQCQESLSLAKLNRAMEGDRRLAGLERTLVQLESDKRREELAFWADTIELRKGISEKAQDYANMKDRASILASFGGQHG